MNVNEEYTFKFKQNLKIIYEYFKNLAVRKNINFEYQMYFEDFDFNDNTFYIVKKIKKKSQTNTKLDTLNSYFSMNNINTSFPVYMKGNKKKLLKIIEILLENAFNETGKNGYIQIKMNFKEDGNLLYFSIQNTNKVNKQDFNVEINKMLKSSNYNISMEFLSCLKINESILGLYNANEWVRQNNGSMKYKHEQNVGTKVMFSFRLFSCDEQEQSSIFTDRSLLNNFN